MQQGPLICHALRVLVRPLTIRTAVVLTALVEQVVAHLLRCRMLLSGQVHLGHFEGSVLSAEDGAHTRRHHAKVACSLGAFDGFQLLQVATRMHQRPLKDTIPVFFDRILVVIIPSCSAIVGHGGLRVRVAADLGRDLRFSFHLALLQV